MTEKKATFVEKVLTFLKGGDEAKIAKFQKGTVKYLKKQIVELKDDSAQLRDKIEDAKEELNEAVLNIDLDRIKTTEEREAYTRDYIVSLDDKFEKIEYLEDGIEENDDLIAVREEQIKLLT